MARKSKQAGGNLPLTHYERTKKFASSEYGTTSQRLAGHSQYQLGDCALSLTKLANDAGGGGGEALCTPSGYLYSPETILEYLLTKTQEIKEQTIAYEQQEDSKIRKESEEDEKKKIADFEESQRIVRKRKAVDHQKDAKESLKRASFWLADSQPTVAEEGVSKPPERPVSPHSQEPLRRKDLWPIQLKWDDNKLVCAVSGKGISTQATTAYWTDKKKPGVIVLTNVFTDLIKESMICPVTSKKIKFVRPLQQSGTSFASSGQMVEVKKYRPTIT